MSNCFYKRKIKLTAVILAVLLTCILLGFFAGCLKKTNSVPQTRKAGLTVSYIDVGQGDCALIMFPDGKNMLIDCGDGSDFAVKSISSVLSRYSIKKIDYLVLTHPDLDHVGGVEKVIKSRSVGVAFLPKILDLTHFEVYANALQNLSEKFEKTQCSELGKYIKGEDYSVAFLSPKPFGQVDSSYNDFNFTDSPTSEQINDISSVVYIEYKGIRFLFTGDIGKSEEIKIIQDYNSAIIKNVFSFSGISVDLENLNFLKVSHHGAEDASGQDFLDLLGAENAIISVAGNNNYGHPSIYTQQRLLSANPNCKLLRTDYYGTISIHVSTMGVTKISTQKNSL